MNEGKWWLKRINKTFVENEQILSFFSEMG